MNITEIIIIITLLSCSFSQDLNCSIDYCALQSCNEETCSACIQGFYLVYDNACLSCSPHCQSCIDASTCLVCLDYYYLSGNQCVSCPKNCLTCSNGKTCKTCFENTVYSTMYNACVSLECNVTGCLVCENQLQNCYTCDVGYTIRNGTCTIQTQAQSVPTLPSSTIYLIIIFGLIGVFFLIRVIILCCNYQTCSSYCMFNTFCCFFERCLQGEVQMPRNYRQRQLRDRQFLANYDDYPPQNWRKYDAEKGRQVCSICLQSSHIDIETHCKHFFHEECLGTWLIKSDSCPECRQQIKNVKKICNICFGFYDEIQFKFCHARQNCMNCNKIFSKRQQIETSSSLKNIQV